MLAYMRTGAVYVIRRDTLIKQKSRYMGSMLKVILLMMLAHGLILMMSMTQNGRAWAAQCHYEFLVNKVRTLCGTLCTHS